jgi:hypothetical protein
VFESDKSLSWGVEKMFVVFTVLSKLLVNLSFFLHVSTLAVRSLLLQDFEDFSIFEHDLNVRNIPKISTSGRFSALSFNFSNKLFLEAHSL